MDASQEMVWFISSIIRPLKFSIKVISVSTFQIMKRKRKIYFMICHRK